MNTNNTQPTPIIAACGLFCTNCRAYTKSKCPGCKENHKASWCAVRACTMEKKIASCAECQKFSDRFQECKKLNNPISKVIGFLFNSNRIAGVTYIKHNGREAFIKALTETGRHAFPCKNPNT